MSLIYRVWVDVEVFDTETEETETVEVEFGPSFTARPVDDSLRSRAAAMAAAMTYAELLHDGRPFEEEQETPLVLVEVESGVST